MLMQLSFDSFLHILGNSSHIASRMFQLWSCHQYKIMLLMLLMMRSSLLRRAICTTIETPYFLIGFLTTSISDFMVGMTIFLQYILC